MRAHIGTSGWQYDSWRGALYEPKLPRRAWLARYAEAFPTVEVNSTFYGTPSAATVAAWAAGVPDDFTFALKVHRFVTHVRRLGDPADSVARFMEHARVLGAKLGPVLLQLPPTLPVHLEGLRAAVEVFPTGQRVAVEFREESWFTDEVRRTLESRDVALCLADRESRLLAPIWRTASWGYLRMHGGRATPRPHYGDAALRAWVERMRSLWPAAEDVYVYFNNDTGGWAPRDAVRMREMLTEDEVAERRTPARPPLVP